MYVLTPIGCRLVQALTRETSELGREGVLAPAINICIILMDYHARTILMDHYACIMAGLDVVDGLSIG